MENGNKQKGSNTDNHDINFSVMADFILAENNQDMNSPSKTLNKFPPISSTPGGSVMDNGPYCSSPDVRVKLDSLRKAFSGSQKHLNRSTKMSMDALCGITNDSVARKRLVHLFDLLSTNFDAPFHADL